MDKDAEKKQLEDNRDYILGWLNHPITQQIEEVSKSEQEALVALICNQSINSLETFFGHFEAVGHLRGLRRSHFLALAQLEEVKEQLKELEEESKTQDEH